MIINHLYVNIVKFLNKSSAPQPKTMLQTKLPLSDHTHTVSSLPHCIHCSPTACYNRQHCIFKLPPFSIHFITISTCLPVAFIVSTCCQQIITYSNHKTKQHHHCLHSKTVPLYICYFTRDCSVQQIPTFPLHRPTISHCYTSLPHCFQLTVTN